MRFHERMDLVVTSIRVFLMRQWLKAVCVGVPVPSQNPKLLESAS